MAEDAEEEVDEAEEYVHTQGGSGGVIGAHENGIDVSYATRYFEDSEWAALSN